MASPIRFVCLSDLHLGADSSLLTHLRPGEEPLASEVMLALVECLESLLAENGGVRPTLVLLGDVLEFALARDEDAAMSFQRFMELAMPEGRELFEEIWYVPGNHDHHLWEGAREAQYAEYVGWRDRALPLERPWHSTRMLHESDEHKVHSPLLTALLRRARPDAATDVGVTTVYPNLGVRRADRLVVFHHGHFIEWPYRLLTMANQYAFGIEPPDHVGDLEADNFAWIDFFWSGLGRCGSAGESIQYAYEHLGSPEEKRELIEGLARGLARSCGNHTWLPDVVEDLGQELTFRAALGLALGAADTWGRKAYYGGNDASSAYSAGVRGYLSTYILEQVRRECRDDLPAEVVLVLGHTHHPLEESDIYIDGFGAPVRSLNAGGWMHETQVRQPLVGASLVVVDDDLDTVSLRLYNEVDDLSQRTVEPREPVNAGQTHSELFGRLADLLSRDPGPWARLVEATDRALRQRG